jgi:hypothetical protein
MPGGSTIRLPRRIRGYRPGLVESLKFFRANARGQVIGNAILSSGPGSASGEAFDPHARSAAVIWRGPGCEPEDVNGWLPGVSGWYVDDIVDIDDSGDLLCIGHRGDASSAEGLPNLRLQWLILAPVG